MQCEEVDKVRDLFCSLVVEGLRREQLPRLTFDFDGSVLRTKARHGKAELSDPGEGGAEKKRLSASAARVIHEDSGDALLISHEPEEIGSENYKNLEDSPWPPL